MTNGLPLWVWPWLSVFVCVLLVCVPVSVERNDQGSYTVIFATPVRVFFTTQISFWLQWKKKRWQNFKDILTFISRLKLDPCYLRLGVVSQVHDKTTQVIGSLQYVKRLHLWLSTPAQPWRTRTCPPFQPIRSVAFFRANGRRARSRWPTGKVVVA